MTTLCEMVKIFYCQDNKRSPILILIHFKGDIAMPGVQEAVNPRIDLKMMGIMIRIRTT